MNAIPYEPAFPVVSEIMGQAGRMGGRVRARALGTIPESKVAAVVAQSLGICESLVIEAMAAGVAA